MRHNPHRWLDYFVRVPLCFVLLGAGLCFIWSGLLVLSRRPGIGLGFWALLAIAVGSHCLVSFRYSVLNLLVYVRMDETGLYLQRRSKVLVSLPWEQVCFTAPCAKDSYRGKQKRFCFAPRVLTEEELEDIGSADRACIYFSALTRQELEFMQAHCPVEIDSSAAQFVVPRTCK